MSAGVRALIGRASADGWGPALERDVDDYENYLATQLERLEDMDPAYLPDDETSQRLMDALGLLLGVVGELRAAAEAGAIAASASAMAAGVDEADVLLGTSPRSS